MKKYIVFNYYQEDQLGKIIDLEKKHVHIWIIEWQKISNFLTMYTHCMSTQEQRQLERYSLIEDKMRGKASNILTKYLASCYLKCSVYNVQINRTKYGKPYLVINNKQHLQYNISHSGKYIALAFTYQQTVGIDIEKKRRLSNFKEIAKHFHPSESNAIQQTNNINLFYKVWTAKESYAKALGNGLLMDLKSFEVKNKKIYKNEVKLKSWTLFSSSIDNDYQLSVTVNNQ